MIAGYAAATPGCACEAQSDACSLIGLGEALAMVVERTRPIPSPVTLPLSEAAGRVLADPLAARAMAPPFDNAAMDGYAVSCADFKGNGPWMLSVVGRVPAGQGASPLSEETALRIFTGAPLPAGADAIVMQEVVRREGDAIRLDCRPAPGQNIRRTGEDMAEGATILTAGHSLDARAIAACAASGQDKVRVRRKQRVALLVIGDEVRQPDETLGNAGIRDVNTPMLRAALARPDLSLTTVAQGVDAPHRLAHDLAALAKEVDHVVTTGGISVGEEDHLKHALAMASGEITFSNVALKPGKPVSSGRMGGALWLGLPGNPVSAFVTWQVFGIALLDRLSGASPARRARRVVLESGISRKAGRCELRPACLGSSDEAGRVWAGDPLGPRCNTRWMRWPYPSAGRCGRGAVR